MPETSIKPHSKPRITIPNPYKRRQLPTQTAFPKTTTVTPEKGTKHVHHHFSNSLENQTDFPNPSPTHFLNLFDITMTTREELIAQLGAITAGDKITPTQAANLKHLCAQIEKEGITLSFCSGELFEKLFANDHGILKQLTSKPAAIQTTPTQNTATPIPGTPIAMTQHIALTTPPPAAPRPPIANPSLSWANYAPPTNRTCIPSDDAQELKTILERAYETPLQTPFDFEDFENRHPAVNASIMALLGLDASRTEITQVITAGRTAYPNQYVAEHANDRIGVVHLNHAALLPAGYSFHRLNNLQWADAILPASCNHAVANQPALTYPVIIQTSVKTFKEEQHNFKSSFVVLHTMANILIPCEHRDAAMYPGDGTNRAYRFFKLGYNLQNNLNGTATNKLDEAIDKQIGSKIFPNLDGQQPTQQTTRKNLKVIAAWALTPPDPAPRMPRAVRQRIN